MIDWLSFSLPYRGAMVRETYFKQPYGSCEIETHHMRPVMFKGSFETGISVMATGSRIYISGNPVKWFTGQNVVGTNDIWSLIRMTYARVLAIAHIPPCPDATAALEAGDVKLSRVDCTFSYMVGTDEDVNTWLKSMEDSCHVRYRGRGHYSAQMNSLMFGLNLKSGEKVKASTRSVFKFYNKSREIEAHPLTCDKRHHALLKSYVYGVVRGEATYRGKELARIGLDMLKNWTEQTAYQLHREWVDKMEITDNVRLQSPEEMHIPKAFQSTYLLWRAGENMQEVLSRRTFYRHRRELRAHGVDIGLPQRLTPAHSITVVPSIEVLKAKPVCEADQEEFFWKLVDMERLVA